MQTKDIVMVQAGMFEERVVHSSKKHPHVGQINYQGTRRFVYVGYWAGMPTWKLVRDAREEQAYAYCTKQRIRCSI